MDLDPFFQLEVLFLRHRAEDACSLFARQRLLSCLPSDERACSVSQSLRDLAAFQDSPLVKDSELGESTQLLDVVEQQLNQLLNSQGPSLGNDPSVFKRQLFDRYTYFFSSLPDLGGEVSRGKAAFLACCDMIQHKFATTPKSLSLQDLKPLSGSSFLMDN